MLIISFFFVIVLALKAVALALLCLRPVRRDTCFSVLSKYEIDLLITAILIHVCLAHGSC